MQKFLSAVWSVLVKPVSFWKELSSGGLYGNDDVLRDYAAPLIGVVQIVKFPLIGVPRPAMIYGVVNFVLDVAVLYLLVGVFGALAGDEPDGASPLRASVLPCFALTPFWLAEPLFFIDRWGAFIACGALLHVLVVVNAGIGVLRSGREPLAAKRYYPLQAVTALSLLLGFILMSGVMRILNV